MHEEIFESSDAALVFFDWLTGFAETDSFDELSDAQRRVLWDLEAVLEKSLPEVVQEDYSAALAKATAAVMIDSE